LPRELSEAMIQFNPQTAARSVVDRKRSSLTRHARLRGRRHSWLRLVVEELQKRFAPAATFDVSTGLLSVVGDENGPSDDVIDVSVTPDRFVEVTINGTVCSSDPNSSAFDPALDGATGPSVLSVLMLGAEGNDALRLGEGVNKLAGGHITLDGGAGNDAVTGSNLFESISGGAGNDTLLGGLGENTIEAGAGDDMIIFVSVGSPQRDSIIDPSGIDTLDFSMFGARLVIDLGKENGEFQDYFSCFGESSCGVAISGTMENVLGSNSGNSITGNAAQNRLSGGAGDDLLSGGLGDDTLIGGAGNDRVDGGDGIDALIESVDVDFTLTDTSATGLGNDTLVAIEQATLTGGGRDNRIDASAFTGPSTLDGMAGDDSLIGGPGVNTFIGGTGNDRLDGGEGSDTVDFGGSAMGVTVNLSRHTARGQGRDVLFRIETVIGTQFDDTIMGDSMPNLLEGGDGDDVLRGRRGSDTVDGGVGDDSVFGDADMDSLLGGLGDDLLRGSKGDDTLIGNEGVDQLFGDAGFDRLVVDPMDKVTDVGRDGGKIIAA